MQNTLDSKDRLLSETRDLVKATESTATIFNPQDTFFETFDAGFFDAHCVYDISLGFAAGASSALYFKLKKLAATLIIAQPIMKLVLEQTRDVFLSSLFG